VHNLPDGASLRRSWQAFDLHDGGGCGLIQGALPAVATSVRRDAQRRHGLYCPSRRTRAAGYVHPVLIRRWN